LRIANTASLWSLSSTINPVEVPAEVGWARRTNLLRKDARRNGGKPTGG
jgi:hypothetical protein